MPALEQGVLGCAVMGREGWPFVTLSSAWRTLWCCRLWGTQPTGIPQLLVYRVPVGHRNVSSGNSGACAAWHGVFRSAGPRGVCGGGSGGVSNLQVYHNFWYTTGLCLGKRWDIRLTGIPQLVYWYTTGFAVQGIEGFVEGGAVGYPAYWYTTTGIPQLLVYHGFVEGGAVGCPAYRNVSCGNLMPTKRSTGTVPDRPVSWRFL